MNLITATELRTKTDDLIESLLNGEEVKLIHRSRIVGVIKPVKKATKIFDAEKVMAITAKMHYPILSDAEIKKRYREAIEKKHGKHLHRR